MCRNHVFTHCSFLEVGPRAEGGPSLQITVVTHQGTAFFLVFDTGRSLSSKLCLSEPVAETEGACCSIPAGMCAPVGKRKV